MSELSREEWLREEGFPPAYRINEECRAHFLETYRRFEELLERLQRLPSGSVLDPETFAEALSLLAGLSAAELALLLANLAVLLSPEEEEGAA